MPQTILFADNDRRIREFCKGELEAAGYRVLLADDGDEALDIAKSITVDVVILDEHMSRCDGVDAARQFKRTYAKLPVILFTTDPDSDQQDLPCVDASVAKTADLSDLKAVIFRLLNPEGVAHRREDNQKRLKSFITRYDHTP